MNRALWYRRFGHPEAVLSLETAPLSTPGADQVQVMMIAAPINPSDVIPITGAYAHRVQPPRVAGYEGLGQVVATSSTSPFRLGQRVLPLRGDGTWQQRLNCNRQWLVPVPEDIADDTALLGYINPLAAQLMLRRWPVRDRQIILTAAGSDCARLLRQWALAGGARRVIGLHRAPEHAPRLRRLGIQPLTMDRQDESSSWRRTAGGSPSCRDAGKLRSALGATCTRHARRRRAATVPFARCPGRDVRQRLAERLYRPLAFTAPCAVIAAGALSAKPLARGAVAVLPVRPRRQASPVSGVVSAGARVMASASAPQ